MSALGATSWCSSANGGLHVWLPCPRTAHPRLRSFGLFRSRPIGSLSGSRPMQQRLVYVEAGQTFSIQRMEWLTPQVSSIHCRLTRGRSLVRSQPGPSRVLAGKAVGRRSFVILVVGRAARYRATYRHLKSGTSFGLEWVHVTALGLERPAWVSRPVARLRVRWLAAPAGVGLQPCALSCCSAGRDRSLFASRPKV